MSTPTQATDMIDILVHDHREVEDLFQELEHPDTETDRRREVLTVAIAELVRHTIAEEMFLYPTARDVLRDGNEIADREIAEHAEAEESMKRLEELEPADARFAVEVEHLISSIRTHITDEENELFPRIRDACTRKQLAELGEKIDRVKQIAPTRPHPSAPNKPPANMLLAPGTGLVDRLRDTLTNRPTSPSEIS